MPSTLREAVRERVTLRAAASLFVALGILRVVVDASIPQLAITVALSVLAGLTDVAEEVYDVRASVTSGWVGAVAVVGSAALLALGEGPVWFSGTFLAVGAWFLLDAVQTARHGGLTADEPDGREVYRDYVARRVHETLDERPHTRRELFAALDADDETVAAALDRLRERGVVEQGGSEFRVPSRETGRLGRVRNGLVGLGQRIARPVLLELESGDDTGERSDRFGEGGHRSDGRQSRASTRDDRGCEREREPEPETD